MESTGLEGGVSPQILLADWWPVICWTVVLFFLSTSMFSAANTSRIIEPILQWLLPSATVPTLGLLHGLIRKLGHFANYAVLYWLLIRGPMAGRPFIAFVLCVAYALFDEGHQVFVPGRTASLYDVALDSSGALFSRFLHQAVA